MIYAEPTADEFRAAYVACKLRRIGVSLQKALATPSTRLALRMTAIAQRKKEQQKDGKPAPMQRALILEQA
jgi:hypothetical protein